MVCDGLLGCVQVRTEGSFHTVADPFRRPQDSIKGLQAPVGTLLDKARVAAMRVATLGRPLETLFSLVREAPTFAVDSPVGTTKRATSPLASFPTSALSLIVG